VSDGLIGGIALLVAGATTAVWFHAAVTLHLPRNRSGFVVGWVLGALLGLVALVGDPGWAGGGAAALAAAMSCFLVFTVAVSRQEVGEDAIRVGDALPSFRAPDEHGAVFDSASLSGQRILLKFFRGHW